MIIPAISLPKSKMSVDPFPERTAGLVGGKDDISVKLVEYTVAGRTVRLVGEKLYLSQGPAKDGPDGP